MYKIYPIKNVFTCIYINYYTQLNNLIKAGFKKSKRNKMYIPDSAMVILQDGRLKYDTQVGNGKQQIRSV